MTQKVLTLFLALFVQTGFAYSATQVKQLEVVPDDATCEQETLDIIPAKKKSAWQKVKIPLMWASVGGACVGLVWLSTWILTENPRDHRTTHSPSSRNDTYPYEWVEESDDC